MKEEMIPPIDEKDEEEVDIISHLLPKERMEKL